jgi:hypothetical protein
MSLDPLAPLYLSSSRCVRPLPRGFTGYVARPARSIETLSLPALHRRDPCGFAFYVTHPIRSILN